MMTVLAGYSITVSELQLLFSQLRATADNEWPKYAPKLLKVIHHIISSYYRSRKGLGGPLNRVSKESGIV